MSPPRYPYANLERFVGDHPSRVLNRDRAQICKWKEWGLSSISADRIACGLGMHPSAIWPSWFDDEENENRCPWCQEMVMVQGRSRYCCSEHYRAAKRQRDRDDRRRFWWWQRLDRYRRNYVEPLMVEELAA